MLAAAALAVAVTAPGIHAQSGFRTTRYTVRDGLPQNSVWTLEQTDDGYVWVGTQGGLARFDGTRFVTYDGVTHPSLATNRILTVHADQDGALWVGTATDGVLRLVDDVFESFDGEVRPRADIRAIEEADGAIWFAGEQLVRYSQGAFEVVPHGSSDHEDDDCRIRDLHVDRRQRLWAATQCGVGLVEDGVWIPRWNDGVYWVVSEGDDGVWAQGENGLRFERDEPPAFPSEELGRINDAFVDANGDEWTVGESVFVDRPDGVVEVDIGATARTVMQTASGAVLIGCYLDGLVSVRRTPFDAIGLPKRGRTRHPVAFVDDSTPYGEVAFAAEVGALLRFEGGDWRPHPASPVIGPIESAHAASAGGFWAAHAGGRLSHVAADETARHLQHDAGRVLRMYEDEERVLWLMTETGLARVDRESWSFERVPGGPEPTFPRVIFAPARDGGSWIGCESKLYRFDGESFVDSPEGRALPQVEIRGIYEGHDGTLWVTTYGDGLARVRGDEVEFFTTQCGLPDNGLGAILVDESRRFWINSNRGVFRLSEEDALAHADAKGAELDVLVLDTGEGNGAAGGWMPDGRMWFPTTDELVFVDPARIQAAVTAPALIVEGIRVGGEPIALTDEISVPPGPRSLEVRFAAISFEDPNVRVQYRLEGADDRWIDAHRARTASYPELPPGDYRFRLRAVGAGVDAARESTLSLRLEPRLWETGAFVVFAVVALVLAAFGFHTVRTARIRRRNEALSAEIAQRVRAEEALREKEDRLQLALSSAELGTWRWEAATNASERDASLNRMLGLEPQATEVSADDFLMRIHPEDRTKARKELARAIEAQEPITREFRVLRGDGSVRWIKDRGRPYYDEHGNLSYVTGVSIDITERRRAEGERAQLEEKLHHRQKMEAIGQLAAGVAHEFNNLLVGILGSAELLRDSGELPESGRGRRWVRDIMRCGQRAALLTGKLLSFSKREQPQTSVFDVGDLIREATEMLGNVVGERVRLETELVEEPALVRADRAQLEQALLNLVLNARDAVFADGTIVLRTEFENVDEALVATTELEAGPHVVISVEDDGCGMSRSTLERVFEPFFTTKALGKGTGLGLSTLFADMARVGGHVDADSREGSGSVFRIRLPLVGDASELVPAKAGDGRIKQPVVDGEEARPTVLVCDDDEVVLMSVATILSEAGYVVLRARGSDQALGLTSSYGGPIDLLLTDVIMPEMTGVELAMELRERRPDMSVLYMSGYPADVLEREGPGETMLLVRKPPTRAVLLERVRDALAGATLV